jgi:hypothetical protein
MRLRVASEFRPQRLISDETAGCKRVWTAASHQRRDGVGQVRVERYSHSDATARRKLGGRSVASVMGMRAERGLDSIVYSAMRWRVARE